MRGKGSVSSVFLLQIFIGLFFALTGIIYLAGYNSGSSQFMRGISKLFGKNEMWELIVALIQLFSGLVLLVGVFIRTNQRSLYLASLAIIILWITNIVMLYFTDSFLKPSLMVWLRDLSIQMIILSGLWGITRKYD